MRRSILAFCLFFVPAVTLALTTSVPSGSNCGGGSPTLCVKPIGVHPGTLEGRKPLIEHVPLHNGLSFEIDFLNGGSQALTFTLGRARRPHAQGAPGPRATNVVPTDL